MRLGSSGNLIIAGTLSQGSDRNVKQDFAPLDPRSVLEKASALPIQSRAYSNAPGVKHYGPTAQHFHAAFGFGESDTGITSVDADGVALAAIQGLNQKVEVRSQEAENRIQKLERENLELKTRLTKLEQLLTQFSATQD